MLPTALIGFFAAVLFGAILSSFNSALNSSITLFSIDFYKQYFHSNASDIDVIRNGKYFGVLLAIAAMIIAPLIAKAPQGLFGYLQEVNGCYTIPILSIIVVGYFTKKVPAIAAKIGIVSGVILYLIYLFLKYFILDEKMMPHFLHVQAIIFITNVGIMLIIGKLYPLEPAFKLTYTQKVVITPYKYIKFFGIAIVIIVIYIYYYFR